LAAVDRSQRRDGLFDERHGDEATLPLSERIESMQGTIHSLRHERGFGFIRDGEGRDVFFHHTSVTAPDRFDSLAVGMAVEFELEPSAKGPRATKLRVLAAASQ
jgi:CspA family cold shock protein